MARLSKLSRSIDGRVAIITGAASGMGRATAFLFADEGARLALIDRNAEPLETVVKEITAAGGDARAYAADLADGDGIPALVERIRADVGPIDILVNNAGISVGAPIDHDMWEKAWDLTLAVNLTAQARLIRACMGDLLRIAIALEGDAALRVDSLRLVGDAGRHACPDGTGAHGVDVDAARPQLNGHRSREADDAVLRCGVGAAAGRRAPAFGRSDIHDAAVAVAREVIHARADHTGLRGEIDRDRQFPRLLPLRVVDRRAG
jgi:NAD(P)-dependent dehydrogenase (short-subunit alcohol dehydrogenase family)